MGLIHYEKSGLAIFPKVPFPFCIHLFQLPFQAINPTTAPDPDEKHWPQLQRLPLDLISLKKDIGVTFHIHSHHLYSDLLVIGQPRNQLPLPQFLKPIRNISSIGWTKMPNLA